LHQTSSHVAQLLVYHRDKLTTGVLVSGPGPHQDESQIPPWLGPHFPSLKKPVKGSKAILRGTQGEGKEPSPTSTRPDDGPLAPGALRALAHPGGYGRRLTMSDLILWSFMIALTPWALDVGWKLIAGGGR
jgi:hypothetical protein